MGETFLVLLTAHLLADFIFQTDAMVARKREPLFALAHVAVVMGMTGLLLGTLNWPIIIITGITHAVFDLIKASLFPKSLIAFVLDQAAHIGVAIGLAHLYPDAVAQGWWPAVDAFFMHETGWQAGWREAALCVVSGVVVSVHIGGLIIPKLMTPLTDQIGKADVRGLRDGSLYIGWLERALVMILILINQPTGVGFLITAKSILRFGDAHDSGKRKLAEYIIIGTFLSFGWGMLAALATATVLRTWI